MSTSDKFTFFVTCPRGTEGALRRELIGMRIGSPKGDRGGVWFNGPLPMAMGVCLHARTAVRVLLRLAEFDVPDARALYDGARAIAWRDWLTAKSTLAAFASVRDNPALTHSGFAALKVKDAVVDSLRDALGARPDVETERPDVSIVLHVAGRQGALFLDLAGDPLHRRGYRVAMTDAPLKETLAAAVLILGGVAHDSAFVDPMAGGGTLAIEHAMAARGLAPGLRRRFGFERWPRYDAALGATWERMRAEAEAAALAPRAPLPPIVCADISPEALGAARRNASAAGVDEDLTFEIADAAALERRWDTGTVCTNPPYGERLKSHDLEALYRSFGRALLRLHGWAAVVLSGSPLFSRALPFKPVVSHRLFNGPLETRLLRYEIPRGAAVTEKASRLTRLGLSALSAAMLYLAVPTVDAWPLMWIALVPQLHVALTSGTARRAFLHGWFTGTLANTVAFVWMDGLLERFGHMSPLEALPIMMLLTTYQGLEFALLSWGVFRVNARTGGRYPVAVVAPLVMAVIELGMPQIFPFYLAISQAWVPALIQIADLTGPIGVSVLMVAWGGALVDAWHARREGRAWRAALRPLAVASAFVVADLAYGAVRIHQVDAARVAAVKVKTGLVQANVGILEKWDPVEFARLLEMHQRLSADLVGAGAAFVVWPESSYPYALPRTIDHELPEDSKGHVRRGFDAPLLFGALTRVAGLPSTPAERYPYNTAIMMDEAGNITGKYDKVFLMLFGEYIPFYDSIPWFTKLFPEASNFSRGSEPASFPLHAAGHDYKVGPLICYEDILPAFTRRVAQLRPNALVNITNDAWFGRTAEPYQHLALAVFRSVENRLEMVRAVNTGVSAHIDAAGRVLARTDSVDPTESPNAPPSTLLVDLAMLDGGGLYRRVGDLFAFGCLLALAALLVRHRRVRAT